jgi:hypothetical protein
MVPSTAKDTHMTTPKTKKPATKAAATPKASMVPRSAPKPANKTDNLIALLKREGGASLTDVTGATGWLPHSARAMLTGLRKKGFTLDKSKVDGVTRWSVTGEPAA